MRIALIAVFAGCGNHGEQPADAAPDGVHYDSCIIENVLATRIADATPTDCGHLAIAGDDAAFGAARQCVLDAIAAHQPFVVLWNIQGIDSRVAGAYLGLDAGGALALTRFHYDGDPQGQGGEARPVTTIGSCSGVAQVACDTKTLHNTLCLECSDEAFADRCGTI